MRARYEVYTGPDFSQLYKRVEHANMRCVPPPPPRAPALSKLKQA